MSVTVSDAELLGRVREGDRDAFGLLWLRHIDVALRLAQRMDPGRAEDLASEAFLSVFQQLTQRGGGPESAFRAYLFTTMRNASLRQRRVRSQEVLTTDLDVADGEDVWSVVESASTSARLLEAFRDLPERWQRVLWLIDVEEVPRRQVAHELGIKPNAVSALVRRARQGLRARWLTNAVPADLRDDETHVAIYIPVELSGKVLPIGKDFYVDHLENCALCAEVRVEIQEDYQRMRRVLLRGGGPGDSGSCEKGTAPTSNPPRAG